MVLSIDHVVIDPEFRDLLPPATPEEYESLKTQYLKDGLFVSPIVVWLNQGILVDGHRRYDIWKELGSDSMTAPDILEKKFNSRGEAMLWMYEHQVGRRNWTNAQRVLVSLKLKPALAEIAKVKQRASGGDRKSQEYKTKTAQSSLSDCGATDFSGTEAPEVTRDKIAKLAAVSSGTVGNVEAVIKHARPEITADMAAGRLSAAGAYQKMRDEQEEPADETLTKKYNRAKNLINKAVTQVQALAGTLGPLVCALDDLKLADPTFAKKHRELLGHHDRLFHDVESAKKAAKALKSAWERS